MPLITTKPGIAFDGNMAELLKPYVDECKAHNKQATLESFHNWTKTVANHNYKIMLEATMHYLLAVMPVCKCFV